MNINCSAAQQQQQGARSNLMAASSVATFEATDEDAFRRELGRSLEQVVRSCLVLNNNDKNNTSSSSKNNNEVLLRYDPSLVEHTIGANVDWMELCKHHEKSALHASTASFNTPLQVLLDVLVLDPRVIPRALVSPILKILVRAFLLISSTLPTLSSSSSSSSSASSATTSTNNKPATSEANPPQIFSRWSPSRLALLVAIKQLMKSTQCRCDLGAIITSVCKTDYCNEKKDPSFLARRAALSLIKYCIKELSSSSPSSSTQQWKFEKDHPTIYFFSSLLSLFQMVMEDNKIAGVAAKMNGGGGGGSPYCSECGANKLLQASTRRGRRKTPFVDISDLHGELDEDEQRSVQKINYHSRQRPIRLDQTSPHKLTTLKQIVNAKEEPEEPSEGGVCPHCQYTALRTSHGGRSVKSGTTIKAWRHLRDKMIHTIIDQFQETRLKSQQRPLELLKSTLSSSAAVLESPYMRICVLQLAETLGANGYKCLISSLWELSWQHSAAYLQWYAEVIVESSFCDDRSQCWEALQPLIKSVRALCQQRLLEGEEAQDPAASSSCDQLLPCLGYILSRRRRVFQKVEDHISQEFSSLTSQLSISYGEIKYWFAASDDIKDHSRHGIVVALQSLGIVGACSLLWDDSETVWETSEKLMPEKQPRTSWSTPRSADLREAYERMVSGGARSPALGVPEVAECKHRLKSDLLSALNYDNQLSFPVKAEPQSASKAKTSDIPMLQYLDDDVLRSILSFLGYKKLLKVRCVCRAWRSLADENSLWLQLYRSRYGLLDDGHTASKKPGPSSLVWQQRFRDKWAAERAVRFQRNHVKEYKYRICRYLDCHHVIKSSEALKKHYAMHENRRAKAEQRLQKKKTKELSKAASITSTKKVTRKRKRPANTATSKVGGHPKTGEDKHSKLKEDTSKACSISK